MSLRILCTLVVLLLWKVVCSQVSFYDGSKELGLLDEKSIFPVSVADINGDGWDDILRFEQSKNIALYLSTQNGKLFPINTNNLSSPNNWAVAVANLDNSAGNEIIYSGFVEGISIFSVDNQNLQLTKSANIRELFFTQAMNIVDIDNDGWLDLFVCNDEGFNKIFMNNKEGQLALNQNIIEFDLYPEELYSGNYGSEWIDIDMDNDLDLYISKCRLDVDNLNDPRRINQLYVQDKNGEFVEKATVFGIANNRQSWASSFADFDNDGDLDLVVINHDYLHNFYENQNNYFVDKTALLNGISGLDYQVYSYDFDNNGWMDILIVGAENKLLWNTGGMNFELDDKSLDPYRINSLAVGDINHDGYLDLLNSYSFVFRAPGYVDDRILLNAKTDNNFVAFHLIGEKSNKNGIGAKVKVFAGDLTLLRQLQAGQSYGIMNSLNVHFGIAKNTKVDSIEVIWPSGIIDKYKDLEPNQYYNVNEGVCLSKYEQIEYEKDVICSEEEIQIGTASNAEAIWSTGQIDNNLSISKSSLVFYTKTDDANCTVLSAPILFGEHELEELEITNDERFRSCDNENIVLSSNIGKEILWNNQILASEYVHSEDDTIVTASYNDGCDILNDTVSVEIISLQNPILESDTVDHGEKALVLSNSVLTNWYLEIDDTIPVFSGQEFETETLLENTTIYAEQYFSKPIDTLTLGEKLNPEDFEFGSDFDNSLLYFKAKENFTLFSVSVFTDLEGERDIRILDGQNSLVFQKRFNILLGLNKLEINFKALKNQQYSITTNETTNRENFGFKGPRFSRKFESTEYPYSNDLMEIVNSNFGAFYYYYFYDWEIFKTTNICTSERVAHEIEVNLSTSNADLLESEYLVFPNPASDQIALYGVDLRRSQFYILNHLGQIIKDFNVDEKAGIINIEKLISGLYYLQIGNKKTDKFDIVKFVKL